jgi:hypothetical protein
MEQYKYHLHALVLVLSTLLSILQRKQHPENYIIGRHIQIILRRNSIDPRSTFKINTFVFQISDCDQEL